MQRPLTLLYTYFSSQKCLSVSFHGPKSGQNRLTVTQSAFSSFNFPTHTFRLIRQVCFKNILCSFLRLCIRMDCFPFQCAAFLRPLTKFLLIPHESASNPSSRRAAPIIALQLDSPFLWTVAKSGIWSEFEWCGDETFRDTLSWKAHYRAASSTPFFIEKEIVL